jgi:hypothetical protein
MTRPTPRHAAHARGIFIASLVFCLTAVWLAPGCGGSSGPIRYPLEGAVTYDGQPVPGGTIEFEPDSSKGNRGPAGYATIENGRYATSPGKGTVGGPHIVRITGTDGKASGESPYGAPIFPLHKATADLPRESATHDFDVPAE